MCPLSFVEELSWTTTNEEKCLRCRENLKCRHVSGAPFQPWKYGGWYGCNGLLTLFRIRTDSCRIRQVVTAMDSAPPFSEETFQFSGDACCWWQRTYSGWDYWFQKPAISINNGHLKHNLRGRSVLCTWRCSSNHSFVTLIGVIEGTHRGWFLIFLYKRADFRIGVKSFCCVNTFFIQGQICMWFSSW